MKYPLLATALAALLSLSTQARQPNPHNGHYQAGYMSDGSSTDSTPVKKPGMSKFQLGVSVGAMNNTMLDLGPHYVQLINWLPPTTPTLVFSLKGIYASKNWRYGLSIERAGLSYRVRARTIGQNLGGHNHAIDTTISEKTISAIRSMLSADRVLTSGKTETYLGATFGLLYTEPLEYLWSYDDNRISGYCAGLHGGVNYHIGQDVQLNAEVESDYVNTAISTFSYSFTLGVRISLNNKSQ
jgi:hypothetical protein